MSSLYSCWSIFALGWSRHSLDLSLNNFGILIVKFCYEGKPSFNRIIRLISILVLVRMVENAYIVKLVL